MGKYFTKKEVIPCYRERKEERCIDCKLMQAVMRLPNGIDDNMEALIDNVMDPVRERLGKPIVVNSGFRCPRHNSYVGGVAGSQHVRGEAIDCRCEDNRKLAKIIVELGKFDQMILYPTFVHVSWKRGGGNRQQILRKTSAGYQKVAPSEVLQG